MAEYVILDEFLSEEAKESADAQGHLHELVRCRNCKHGCDWDNGKWKCIKNGGMHEPNWFCADGRRKGGDN